MNADTPTPGAYVAPFTVLIDEREIAPYFFTGFASGGGRHILAVPTRTVQLHTGDYSLDGLTAQIAVERKSLEDLYGTLTRRRAQFDNELSRLDTLTGLAAVVVEADWAEVLNRPPPNARLPPAAVLALVLQWQVRYPRVCWWFVPGRRLGETVTLRLLERYALEYSRRGRGGGAGRGNAGTAQDLLGSQ